MKKSKIKKLPRSFYNRPTLTVAHELIGKYIIYNSPSGKMSARIVEVEAYIGQDDPACHAARGKTKRNEIMFGMPGFSYIYFIYGMYYCLNFVTESEGHPAAVLLRSAEPSEGIELMLQKRSVKKTSNLLSGPGKFCQAFGLSKEQNGLDLLGTSLYLEDRYEPLPDVTTTSRIGINHGKELLWRFYDNNSNSVSKTVSTK